MFGRVVKGSFVAAATLILAMPAHAASNVLDNGKIRVAVDLDQGGRISWVSRSSGSHVENLVSDSEQAYSFFFNQATARVVSSRTDRRGLYVRSYSDPCGCTYETWITLDGRAARVRQRVTTERWQGADDQWSQEVPPLYSGSHNTRVVTYDGRVHDVTSLANFPLYHPMHYDVTSPEHWIALVDADGAGVGLVEPDLTWFIAAAQPYRSYVAGLRLEQLDRQATYEYSYALVVGSVAQIRAYARAHRTDSRPNYTFANGRAHFLAKGSATPAGAIRLPLDSHLDGPQTLWHAGNVQRLYVRGAWHSRQSQATLLWTHPGSAFDAQQSRSFFVIPDGTFHTYRVDVFRSPWYTGTISGIRLDPAAAGEPGGWVDITCISYRPCPIDRAAERRLLDQPRIPFRDTFDRLDPTFWSVTGNSTGALAGVEDGVLGVAIAHDAVPLPGQDSVGAGVWSRCSLDGNFVAEVDYVLVDWPDRNNVHVSFSADDKTLYRSNDFGEQVGAWFPPFGSNVPEDRLHGTLRFERIGDLLSGEYLDANGRWYTLSATRSTGGVHLSVSLWASKPAGDVSVAFDDVRVSRGRLTCPSP